MIGLGAIVKSFTRALDQAVEGLRLALRDRRPKPCPIPVPTNSRRPRPRD